MTGVQTCALPICSQHHGIGKPVWAAEFAETGKTEIPEQMSDEMGISVSSGRSERDNACGKRKNCAFYRKDARV